METAVLRKGSTGVSPTCRWRKLIEIRLTPIRTYHWEEGESRERKWEDPEKKEREVEKEKRVEAWSVEVRGWHRLPQLLGTGWRFPGLRANLRYVDDGRSHLSITDRVFRLPRTRAWSLSRSGNWAFSPLGEPPASPPRVKTLWVSSS